MEIFAFIIVILVIVALLGLGGVIIDIIGSLFSCLFDGCGCGCGCLGMVIIALIILAALL